MIWRDRKLGSVVLASLLMLGSGVAQAGIHDSLFYAAREGLYESASRLIDQHANVNYANGKGETPMHAAASQGHLQILQLLRSKGARHDRRTVGGWYPLHHAVRFGHVQAARYLLNMGTPLHVRTREGKSVFDLANATGNRAMLNFLRDYSRHRR